MQHPSTLGDAYWSDPEDIAERFAYIDGESFWLGRNPQRFEDKIGSRSGDSTHVGLFGKSRGSKGRSFIVPNLIKWKGSIVVIDPKGENASICAARRAFGDGKHCKGVGQATYVLDPNRSTKNVPEELYASCNLLDCLDPEDPALFSKCSVLANSLTIKPSGGDSADWSSEGIGWTSLVMAHVVTDQRIPEGRRHLGTVRDFVNLGNEAAVEAKRQANLKAKARYDDAMAHWEQAGSPEGEKPSEPRLWPKIHPIDQLLDEMSENSAINGNLAKTARKFRNIRGDSPRQWAGIFGHATRELEFLNNVNIEESVFGASGSTKRALSIKGIKDDPLGVSIFICLTGREGDPSIRWQRALLALICEEMQQWQGTPACGYPLLMSIDEFLDLKHMEQIKGVLNQGAGAGIKMFLSILDISGLYDNYGEHGGEQILAGLETKIWLGFNDNVTPKWVENHIGEAHVEIETNSDTKGESFAKSKSTTKSETTGTSGGESRMEGTGHQWGTAVTDGIGESTSLTKSDAKTANEGSQWSVQSGTGLARTHSDSRGRQSGRSFQPHVFFKSPFPATSDGVNSSKTDATQRSENNSRSTGGQKSNGRTLSTARAKQKSSNHSETKNESFNTQSSKTYNEGWMKSNTTAETEGTVHTEQRSRTTQQTLHKRPLLTRPLYNRLTKTFHERDHPFYPGLALITVGGEDAFFVLKSHYDEDPEFAGLFTPHYAYDFIPIVQQRLLGAQYTLEHILPLRVPDFVMDEDLALSVQVHVPTDEWFQLGDKLFTWEIASPVNPEQMLKVSLSAPCEGKVIDIDTNFAETGNIMCIRTELPLLDDRRQGLYSATFRELIDARSEARRLESLRQENERKLAREAELSEQREKEQRERARKELDRQRQFEAYTNLAFIIPFGLFTLIHTMFPLAMLFAEPTDGLDLYSIQSLVTAPLGITLTALFVIFVTAPSFWAAGIVYFTIRPVDHELGAIDEQLKLAIKAIHVFVGQAYSECAEFARHYGVVRLFFPVSAIYLGWYFVTALVLVVKFLLATN